MGDDDVGHDKVEDEEVEDDDAVKMPWPSWSTLIKHRPLLLPQEPPSVDILYGSVGGEI